jgi:hypothetical protein
MDDYDHRPGGTLKLKGGVMDGGVSKKYVQFCSLLGNEYNNFLGKRSLQSQSRRTSNGKSTQKLY